MKLANWIQTNFTEALESLSEEALDALVEGLVESGLGLSKEEMRAVTFVFWMSARIEKFVGRAIQEVLGTDVRVGPHIPEHLRSLRQEILEEVTDDLYLLGKVKLLSKIVAGAYGYKPKEAEDFLRQVNNLRNDISHNRYKNLTYGGQSLVDLATRKKMLGDFKDIFKDLYRSK